jgi:hypothetical protein
MKKLLAVAVLTIAAFAADALGDWYGTLEAGENKLRLALHIAKDNSGKLKATLDSLDQGAMGMAAGSVKLEGNKLKAEWPEIGGSLEGQVNADATQFEGNWSQGGQSLPLKLNRKKFD